MDIKDVTVDQIARVYSGLPGCGCGCRGKYYDAPNRMVKRVLNILQGLREDEREARGGRNRGLGYQPGVYFYETENRYYWIYLKEDESK